MYSTPKLQPFLLAIPSLNLVAFDLQESSRLYLELPFGIKI